MSIRIKDQRLGITHTVTGDGRDIALDAWEILAERERNVDANGAELPIGEEFLMNIRIQEDALGYVTGGEGI